MSESVAAEGAGLRRMERLAGDLEEGSLHALLVSAPANVRYLTGFTGSNGIAIVVAASSTARSGLGPHRFLTDFRYETQAEAEVGAAAPGCERIVATGELIEAAAELLTHSGAARIGFEEQHLSVARHRHLTELVGDGAQLIGTAGLVERLREVKEADELRRIAAAARLADEALQDVLRHGLIGRSEREVAIALAGEMRALGAEGESFPAIVAAGAHAALPHAQPREVAIERGQLVTIDWGARLDGYCSDCTRTFAAGEPSERAREVYELVLAAQQAGLAAVRPGRSGPEVDAAAREVIERAGEGERFGHGLGHGVGVEVHEGPRLSRTASDEPLLAGNVVTIEPGLYLPGELGVRIEDLVAVTGEGCRNLSSLPKELTILD